MPLAATTSLLAQILALWKQPREIDAATIAAIDALFPRPTAGELQGLFDAGDNPDAAGIEQLLFYPDEQIQLLLEERITARHWTESDRAWLAGGLAQKLVRAEFFFPAGRGCFFATMSRQTAAAFIARLRLQQRLPGRVLGSLVENVHQDFAVRARVVLRNSSLEWNANREDFFCLFFQKLRCDNLFPALVFAAEFLRELAPDENILEGLLKKKRRLFSYLQLSQRAAVRLRSATMETIVGSGIRIPHVDRDAVVRQMSIVDCITQNLFGVRDDSDQLIAFEEAWLADSNTDEIFRILR